mmetsp:Transcript_24706/g.52665  ORF Transcript_24706/g.52665 Transcript_24706/m.52665 type:complete len:82 (+) Transcript_24706:243-488(+)
MRLINHIPFEAMPHSAFNSTFILRQSFKQVASKPSKQIELSCSILLLVRGTSVLPKVQVQFLTTSYSSLQLPYPTFYSHFV